METGSTKIF